MTLMTFDKNLPFPINNVFNLTVDLENAPRWHSIFTHVQQLTPNPIGIGSQWQMNYGFGHFTLTITDYQPPTAVTFQGTPVMGGTIPNFTINLQTSPDGTHIHYTMHPDIPRWLAPAMKIIAPPYGRRDLNRYFREMEAQLAKQYVSAL